MFVISLTSVAVVVIRLSKDPTETELTPAQTCDNIFSSLLLCVDTVCRMGGRAEHGSVDPNVECT